MKEKWKYNNEKYMFLLQNFLDVCENIKDEELKKRVINAMIACDKCLTNLINEEFDKNNK